MMNKNPKYMSGNKYRKPCVCVARMSTEESDAMLEEAIAQLRMAAHRPVPSEETDSAALEIHREKDAPVPEGDGEEIFGQMVDDLLYTAFLLDRLYFILNSLADNRVCKNLALSRGAELVQEADGILEKWQRYSLPEV